jgi:ABC-type Fe3+-hydroxamate transport system substrate-binding protein
LKKFDLELKMEELEDKLEEKLEKMRKKVKKLKFGKTSNHTEYKHRKADIE